ncbi:catalytic protein [Spatholobus suberectus]|nr:catalytic protein [Spatholobus suberectus]
MRQMALNRGEGNERRRRRARMTEGCIRIAVEAIHSSPFQAVLHLAGGASQVVGSLLSVPGASNTVLEVVVPYSKMSLIQLLGKIPSQFCSQQTAEDMALLAYNRALKLSTPGSPVVGVGFTGSLASSRPKLGEHRFYMSTRTADQLWISRVTLTKGLRTREEEDRVSSHLLIKAIANACKVPATSVSVLSESDVSDECETQFNEDQQLEQLINGQICFKIYPFANEIPAERKIIMPGSFNPLHDGHLKLMEVATRQCRQTSIISVSDQRSCQAI